MALGMTALGETEHSNYACAKVVQSRDAILTEGDAIACQAGDVRHLRLDRLFQGEADGIKEPLRRMN
jgi:hypothetical protein